MRECDLIMKGGITSGVVYPKAITTIAGSYRLRDIGGTSAGAIAAAVAGAAEYQRQTGTNGTGFAGVEALADELGADMQSLFQPSPRMQPLFDILMALIGRRPGQGAFGAILPALLRHGRGALLSGGIVGLILVLVGARIEAGWLVATGLVLGLVILIAKLAALVLRQIKVDLPAHDFGICPGTTQAGNTKPAFTDWLADRIDQIAGNTGPDGTLGRPLTAGDLRAKGIRVAAMTTDLSTGRPYQLPLETKRHLFSRAEFARLFPDRVVSALVAAGAPFATETPGLPRDLHWLPVGDDFPVVLIARMSLSLPGLIAAIPLYRFDDQLRDPKTGDAVIARCVFSDGGISSNFPVHLFDTLLPSRPTFGIALGPWEAARHGETRVDLPARGLQSVNLAVRPPQGLGGFISRVVNTSKDWQDTLQSMLPGTADRIVTVRLDEAEEGGLNLTMGPATIAKLVALGEQAGRKLIEEFDFDEHRWQRMLALMPNLEGALTRFAAAHDAPPDGAPDAMTGAQVLTEHDPQTFKANSATWRREALAGLAENLATLGRAAAAPGAQDVRSGKVPAIDASIRLVAEADRVPRGGGA